MGLHSCSLADAQPPPFEPHFSEPPGFWGRSAGSKAQGVCVGLGVSEGTGAELQLADERHLHSQGWQTPCGATLQKLEQLTMVRAQLLCLQGGRAGGSQVGVRGGEEDRPGVVSCRGDTGGSCPCTGGRNPSVLSWALPRPPDSSHLGSCLTHIPGLHLARSPRGPRQVRLPAQEQGCQRALGALARQALSARGTLPTEGLTLVALPVHATWGPDRQAQWGSAGSWKPLWGPCCSPLPSAPEPGCCWGFVLFICFSACLQFMLIYRHVAFFPSFQLLFIYLFISKFKN